MKSIKPMLLFLAFVSVSFSCSKSSGDSGPACESNETTKVTFKNNGSTTLRVEVAQTFNAQFEPVSPVVAIDLAAGASSVKEFRYGRYFIQWKNGCPAACSQRAFYAKDFAICQEYQETQ
jgi:hypothetical protein